MSSQLSRLCCWLTVALLAYSIGVHDAAAHTRVNSPDGGETLQVGEVFLLEWMVLLEHDLENWDLWYSTTSFDGPWIDIAMNVPAGDPTQGAMHQMEWTVPNSPSQEAWVRVRQDNVGDEDYFDVSDASFSIIGNFAACDFDGGGICDINDLNQLLAQGPIAAGVATTVGVNDHYDLNNDGTLNLTDRDDWLAAAGIENGMGSAYSIGDANLDGLVDGADFRIWSQHKFSPTLNWNQGDFNGDGFANGHDFLDWNAQKSSVGAANSVPEPNRLFWVCCLSSIAARSGRNSSRNQAAR